MTGNNKVSRRRFLRATGGAASALALAGCTGGPDEDTETEAPEDTETEEPETDTPTPSDEFDYEPPSEQPSGQMFERINSTVTTIDPPAATDEASNFVIQNVHDGLTNYPDGNVAAEALLASDWEVSSDFQTFTFSLTDATFHHGEPVTASDVVYSFDRLAGGENTRRSYFILDFLSVTHETDGDGNYVPGSLGVTAVDESTVEVALSKPFHMVLEILAYASFSIVPENIVGDIDGYDGMISYQDFATQRPVGAGPFAFSKWEKGTEVTIYRYDDYHGTVPSLAGVHWQVIEDDDAAYNYAMNRNADMFGIPTSYYDPAKVNVAETDDQGRYLGTYGPIRNGDTVNYLGVREPVTYYLGFNMAATPKPIRQAFAYAMDQNTIVREVFKQRGSPAYHLTPPGLYPGGGAAYDQHAQEYPYGQESLLDEAKRVMEEAGYGSDNRYELTMTAYQSTTFEAMLNILRDQLTAAYIDMKIEQTPFSTMLERGRNGELEAWTLGWGPDWPEADNFLQLINPPQTDTSLDAPVSYVNWRSETGDAAADAEEAWQTISENTRPTEDAQAVRNEAYVKMEEAAWEDVPFVYLLHPLGELFWYDWVDKKPYGPMGESNQKFNEVTVDPRS